MKRTGFFFVSALLLTLALNKTSDVEEIQRMFDEY